MTGRCGWAICSISWYLSRTTWLLCLLRSVSDLCEPNESNRLSVLFPIRGVGVPGRPKGPGVGNRPMTVGLRSNGLMSPLYEVAVMSGGWASASNFWLAESKGSGAAVTHYITLHSPSFCWPILLRVMRSRCRGPFLPERLSSSRRSRAFGKSWAVLSLVAAASILAGN